MKFIFNSLKIKYLNLSQAKNWLNTYRYSLFILTILITLGVMGIRRLGALQALELLAYDWMINLDQQEQRDPRFLVVEITDKDIQNYSNYPIRDEIIAQLLKKIQKHQPTVVGFD